MINLHIYPTPFTHESRVLRETAFLARAAQFSQIVMVGTARAGLPAVEQVDAHRTIRRFERTSGAGLLSKTVGTLAWLRRVYVAFRNEPLACINCHSLPVLPLGVVLAWRTGAKLVYDAHELETETDGLRGLRQAMSKLVERMCVRRAHAMIVVSDSIAAWYAKTYRITKPAVVLNTPEHAAPPVSDSLRTMLGIPSDRRIYLYQGMLIPARGIEAVCDAFELLPAPRPVLVFMGDGPLVELVRARAAKNPDIRHVPAVPPTDILRHTASADVGLCLFEHTCLSYYFCMPNKLFEYIRAGIPVICSDLPELRRVVNGEHIGLIAPDARPESIAAAVTAMEQRHPQSFAGALAQAADKYSWTRQTTVLAALYQELGLLGPRQFLPERSV